MFDNFLNPEALSLMIQTLLLLSEVICLIVFDISEEDKAIINKKAKRKK